MTKEKKELWQGMAKDMINWNRQSIHDMMVNEIQFFQRQIGELMLCADTLKDGDTDEIIKATMRYLDAVKNMKYDGHSTEIVTTLVKISNLQGGLITLKDDAE